MAKMVAKMNQQESDVDFFAVAGVEDEEDDVESKKREQMMREKFDEFFSSESDEIEADLIDCDSSEGSDSEVCGLEPGRFEELIEAQK